ncbi:TraR/DksA C4-type zinc finger protein [Candidatus Giovannonibacteria bacterium]|nr:TraR/DksA C4-type zinc finger protein [Candidatus Giovannonibacteria bacterium]
MTLDLDYYRKKLEEEKLEIEEDLKSIAERNPEAPEDWNVKYPNLNVMNAAKEEIADQEAEYENRAPVELGLESRLREINEALERANHGKFGTCAAGGEEIGEARLRANPAARTCVAHDKE